MHILRPGEALGDAQRATIALHSQRYRGGLTFRLAEFHLAEQT